MKPTMHESKIYETNEMHSISYDVHEKKIWFSFDRIIHTKFSDSLIVY
jgi:hypothetical protein